MSSPRSSATASTEKESAASAAGDNMVTPGSVDCTQPGNEFGPYWSTLSSEKSLRDLRRLCRVPENVEFALPGPSESPESVRPGYCCVYEVYFKGCGLIFPIPELLLLYLEALELALPQCTPNLIRNVLCAITVAMETNFAIGLDELAELFSVRIARGSGTFTLHPRTDRALFDGFPLKDENWRRYWFLFKIDESSVGGFSQIFRTKFLSGSAEDKLKRPDFYQGFLHFFMAISEQDLLWNSFTIERIHRGLDLMKHQFGRKIKGTFDEIWSGLGYRERRSKEMDMLDVISTISKEKRASPCAGVHRNAILVNDGSPEALRVFGRPPSPPPGLASSAGDDFGATLASLPRKTSKKRGSSLVIDSTTSSSQRTKRTRPEMPPPSASAPQTVDDSRRAGSNEAPPETLSEVSFPPELIMHPPTDSTRGELGASAVSALEKRPRVEQDSRVQGSKQTRPPRRGPTPNPAFSSRDRAANVIKHLGTQAGDPVPQLDRWRPEIREFYSRYSYHAAQCAGFVTSLVNCYETRVIPDLAGNESLQKRVSTLEQSGKELKDALVQAEARASSADVLKLELEKAQELGRVLEQKIQFHAADASSSKRSCEAMSVELHSLKAKLREQELKSEALVKLRDHDLKVSEHSARKSVKTRGQRLFDDISEFLRHSKAREKAEKDLIEISSNKLLLGQIIEDKISASDELEVLDSALRETKKKLSSLPPANFDLQKYAEYFVESPPIDETGPSLTCEENFLEGNVEPSAPSIQEVNFSIPPYIYQFGSNFFLLDSKQMSDLRTPIASEVNIPPINPDVLPQVSEKNPSEVAASDP